MNPGLPARADVGGLASPGTAAIATTQPPPPEEVASLCRCKFACGLGSLG
jgi:hypothetical protein